MESETHIHTEDHEARAGKELSSPTHSSEVLEPYDATFLAYNSRVEEVRARGSGIDHEDLDALAQYRHELAKVQANFPGDWTLLELQRVLDPKTLEKYKTLIDSECELREGVRGMYDKEPMYRSFYEQELDRDKFSKHVADVFLSTRTVVANEDSKTPQQLGVGAYRKTGTVFSDAEVVGVLLGNRQKNIIEAHEKIHGIFSFNDSPMGARLRHVLDTDSLAKLQENQRTTYLREPDEILARMSQLRNYFGMGAEEEFTPEHLAIASARYVADTKLDNDVQSFLSCITDKTEKEFLQIMNTYPM